MDNSNPKKIRTAIFLTEIDKFTAKLDADTILKNLKESYR